MLEATQQHLTTLSDAVLAAMYLQAMEAVLESGQANPYDPDADVDDIDDPDSELPCTNELVMARILDMVKIELERRAIVT
jgi:hypothetical protein